MSRFPSQDTVFPYRDFCAWVREVITAFHEKSLTFALMTAERPPAAPSFSPTNPRVQQERDDYQFITALVNDIGNAQFGAEQTATVTPARLQAAEQALKRLEQIEVRNKWER
jgi:hypothetical protein